MVDLGRVSPDLLEPVAAIVAALVEKRPGLDPDDVMVVGAQCRDILHAAQGHQFATAATHDVDLALAVRSRQDISDLVGSFQKVGSSGIRYQIAGSVVDLIPFGDIEHPSGVATPTERGESLSVWGMVEAHASACSLTLDGSLEVRVPTRAGYAALKLAAWLDRREPRDVADLALAAYWYANDAEVENSLWGDTTVRGLLVREDLDVTRASIRRLGIDVAEQIGAPRREELDHRWSPDDDSFVRDFRVVAKPDWTGGRPRRQELIGALARGVGADPSAHDLSP